MNTNMLYRNYKKIQDKPIGLGFFLLIISRRNKMKLIDKVINKAIKRIESLEVDYMELSNAIDIIPCELETLDNKNLQKLWKESKNFFELLKQYIPNANHEFFEFLWYRVNEKKYGINFEYDKKLKKKADDFIYERII